MQVPIDSVQEKRFRRLGEEGADMLVHMVDTVAARKDMAPVPPLQLLVYPRLHARGWSDGGGWHRVAVLPQFQVALEAARHTKLVRHPTIRTNAEGVIASLPQHFWEQRIAVRVRQVKLMGTMLGGKHAGEQGYLRGQAPAARRNSLFVDHAFSRNGVNMGRRGAGVAITREALGSGSIKEQDDDVRYAWHQTIIPNQR